MKKRSISYWFPLIWCSFTIVSSVMWFFVDSDIWNFNLMFLFGFNTLLNSLEMFIGGALFGDGLLLLCSVPYLFLLIAFFASIIIAMLILLIKKSNKLFAVLLLIDCIISVSTIVILCLYNAEDAFLWDKAFGVFLNFLFYLLITKHRGRKTQNTRDGSVPSN